MMQRTKRQSKKLKERIKRSKNLLLEIANNALSETRKRELEAYLGRKFLSEAEKAGKLSTAILVLASGFESEKKSIKKEKFDPTEESTTPQVDWETLEGKLAEILNCRISLEYQARASEAYRVLFSSPV